MKKIVPFLFLFFSLLLILPLASSADFQPFKDSNNFSKGETFLTKFSGNFIDQPTDENIFFYKGHVRIPVVFGMEKISGEFYLYASLTGRDSGNYSVSVENVRYMSGAEVVEDPISSNFTITEEIAGFSLNQGFIKTSEDFSLEVQNLQTGTITIQIETSGNLQSADSIILFSGEIKEIDFEILTEDSDEMITLSSGNLTYEVPVFLGLGSETISKEGEKSFRFEPKSEKVSLPTDSEAKRIIYLVNTGDEKIEDITLFLSPLLENYVTLSPETINDIDVNTTEKIEVFIISDLEEAILEGEIIASAENLTKSMTLTLDFIKDFQPTEAEKEEQVLTTTCAELEGTICETGTECSQDPSFVKDGKCCLANCEEVKEGSSGKLIGWAIVLVIVILVIWFFKKRYRGVRSKINLTKIAMGGR
ncbi:MAG TPA: hypothetical protein ENH99_02910 [Candidatus Pacearchaeota archaeon]|nr:hypothetical protein [Candidatus Pacearchaeota archaeon]